MLKMILKQTYDILKMPCVLCACLAVVRLGRTKAGCVLSDLPTIIGFLQIAFKMKTGGFGMTATAQIAT